MQENTNEFGGLLGSNFERVKSHLRLRVIRSKGPGNVIVSSSHPLQCGEKFFFLEVVLAITIVL